MGVRVRLSRNASMYVPFWIAIPVYLIWIVAVICWYTLVAVWWLLAGLVKLIILAVHAIAARQRASGQP